MQYMKHAVLLALAIGLCVCAPLRADQPAHVVTIRDYSYKPAELTVQTGEQVQFVNRDDDAHSVTATDGSFDSKLLDTGKSWTYTFSAPGTYTYVCSVHPSMQGKIIVKAAQ